MACPHPVRPPENGFDDLLFELTRAEFETLFRLARVLEGQLERMERLRCQACRATGHEHAELVARHEAARETALQYGYYLQVQREIMGLRPGPLHDDIQVPGPLQ